MTTTTTTIDPDQVWIYHERQESQLCGQHALNNLCQDQVFSAGQLAEIAQQLDDMEMQVFAQSNEGGVHSRDYQRRLAEGSHNVDEYGNFSIQVLRAALEHQYGCSLPHLSQQDLLLQPPTSSNAVTEASFATTTAASTTTSAASRNKRQDVTEYQGFLCHKSDHWLAIRLIGGRWWNLNSTLPRPVLVSHFQLGKEMETWQGQGYTIFCVPSGLPPAGLRRGAGPHWHRMSDLLLPARSGPPRPTSLSSNSSKGHRPAAASSPEPWKGVGSGLRLDGKGAVNPVTVNHHHQRPEESTVHQDLAQRLDELSEEEQLLLALQQSMEPAPTVAATPDPPLPPVVPAEPAPDNENAIRIQFRLPHGGPPVVRRFVTTDPVAALYAYVQQKVASAAAAAAVRPVELRYGFPPRDLQPLITSSLGEAKLAGECILARFK